MAMKGKIRSNDENTNALIFSAFYRSLLIYFLTPIYAAGGINKLQIDLMEANLKRK